MRVGASCGGRAGLLQCGHGKRLALNVLVGGMGGGGGGGTWRGWRGHSCVACQRVALRCTLAGHLLWLAANNPPPSRMRR